MQQLRGGIVGAMGPSAIYRCAYSTGAWKMAVLPNPNLLFLLSTESLYINGGLIVLYLSSVTAWGSERVGDYTPDEPFCHVLL
jgi:hypothetical protein